MVILIPLFFSKQPSTATFLLLTKDVWELGLKLQKKYAELRIEYLIES